MGLKSGTNLGIFTGATSLGENNYKEAMDAAWRAIDLFGQATVLDKDRNTPPGSPTDGDAYIVGPSPTGAWATHAGQITRWDYWTSSWEFYTPKPGWTTYVQDEHAVYVRFGSSWFIQSTAVDVTRYGADPTGGTDSTSAYVAAMADVTASVGADPAGGDRLSRRFLYSPAGTYLISDGILTSSYQYKGRGFRWQGDGPGLTQINFVTSSGKTLLYNNNSYLWSEVSGILFTGNSRTNTFYYAYSNPASGAVQRWKFTNCEWGGQWGYGFKLEGTNNNSEYSWIDCGVNGGMGSFLYTPSGTASDQHLNYWFSNMKFWPTDSGNTNNWIEMWQGGHVHIINSDVSGYQNGCLYKLKNATHANGVCSFTADNVRYEMKTDNTKVMECEWSQGNVTFNANDWSSQRTGYASSTISFDFSDVNAGGTKIAFRDCSLIGTLRFAHNTDDFRYNKITTFDNCDFQQEECHLAFSFTTLGTNDAGHRAVTLRNCKGLFGNGMNPYTSWAATTAYTLGTQRRVGNQLYEVTVAGTSGSTAPAGKDSAIVDGTVTWKWVRTDSRLYLTDQTLNATSVVGAGGLTRRWAIFRQSDGNYPLAGGYINYILPPNAIIVSANLYFDGSGGTFGSTSNFKIQTEENTPQVLASVNVSPGSAAFANAWTGFIPVGTDIKKRSLVLVSGTGVTTYNSRGYAVVEYLA